MLEDKNVLTWHEYFLSIAYVCSKRSKDPNTKVGVCIVDENNRIVSTGYNGLAKGILDSSIFWKREGLMKNTKYPYIIHAEMNALIFAQKNLNNNKLYTTLFPCSICSKLIIQSGIKKIYYLSDKYKNSEDIKIAKSMFESAKVDFNFYDIKINFKLSNQNDK